VETRTKTFCKPQILTEKRSLRSPKKRSDSGLCQVALGDWPRKDKAMGHTAIRSYNTHHRTKSTFFSPTTTIAEAETRAAYLRPTTRPPNVLFVGIACSVRWERMFFSLGTHILFVGHTFCSFGTPVIFVGNALYVH